MVDMVFPATGTRLAMRTAVPEIRKVVWIRGTVLLDSKRLRRKQGKSCPDLQRHQRLELNMTHLASV